MTGPSASLGAKGRDISEAVDSPWRSLYRIGAVAAIIAGLVFRRNLGAAEIPLFTGIAPPSTVVGWFTLLQSNSLLGLALLNVFDIVDYALVGLMFLAVFAALRKASKSYALIAATLAIIGAGVYIVSNSALSMFSLSNQYVAAATDAEKSKLLAAGQAVLASGYNPGALYQSEGFCLSLLLVAVAGLLISAIMLQTSIFGKATAYVGVVASLLDLVYLVGLVFVPQSGVYVFSAVCIATAGLFLMVWHLLIGVKLFRLGSTSQVKGGVKQ